MILFKITPELVVDLERIEQIKILPDDGIGFRSIELRFITGRVVYIHQDTPEYTALLEFINKVQ